MRRLFVTLFGAMVLAVGAGAAPAAAASARTVGASHPVQPSVNEQQCSTNTAYDIRLCLALFSSTFVGQATVHSYPSNCAGYRVYLYDWYTDNPVVSTSLRPCGESPSKQATADASRFLQLTAYAEFVMFDSVGNHILTIDTPPITYP